MFKHRLFRSPTLMTHNTEKSTWISGQKGFYSAPQLPQNHEGTALKALASLAVSWPGLLRNQLKGNKEQVGLGRPYSDSSRITSVAP